LTANSIRVHLADLDAIPLSLPKRLALASIAMFPSSYSYNPISGVIEVDCDKLADEWGRYIGLREFDENVKRLLDLLDRVEFSERARVCGAGKLQDLAKKYALNTCTVLQDLTQVSVAYDTQNHVLQVLWGSAPRIQHRLVPFIVRAPEFMESARVFPALQLVTVERKGRDVPVEGFERAIEISCPVYVAIIIGVAKTYLGRVRKQNKLVYHFLVPDAPDRDLCTRVAEVFDFIRSAMDYVQSLSETLWYLFLATSIRSFTCSVTLYGVYSDGKPSFELRVDFDSIRSLSLVLGDIDKGLAVPRLVIATAGLLQDKDPDKRRLGELLEEALHSFAKLAFGVGDPMQSALHMFRVLRDRSIHSLTRSLGDEGERIVYYIDVLMDVSQELMKLYGAGVR